MIKYKLLCFIVVAVVLSITGCKKGNDSPIITLTTGINFINASNDTLNFYVNGSRLNTLAASYPLGSTGYLSTPLGEQNYQVKKDGAPAVLFNLSLPLDTGKIYSVFLTGSKIENTFRTIDTLTGGPDTVSMLRFVHTSPNAGKVDVLISDVDTSVHQVVKLKSREFKSLTAFVPLIPGVKHIQILKAGTQDVISDETRTLQIRRMYTLFTKGTLTDRVNNQSGTGLTINK